MSRDYTSRYMMLNQYCKTEGLSTDYFMYHMHDDEKHSLRKILHRFKKQK